MQGLEIRCSKMHLESPQGCGLRVIQVIFTQLYSIGIWSTQTSVPHCNTPEVPCWCMISPAGHPLIAWRSGSWMRGKMRSRPLVQGAGGGCHTCVVVSKYHGHL